MVLLGVMVEVLVPIVLEQYSGSAASVVILSDTLLTGGELVLSLSTGASTGIWQTEDGMENQRVLEQSPDNYDSLKNIAVLYQQMQRWPDALDYAQRAQAIAPEADAPSWDTFIQNIQQQLNSQ